MKRAHTITTLALAGTLGASALFAPIAARADANSDRNAAIGLGALATGLLLTQRNKVPGLIAAGGALYEYSQYQRDAQNCYPADNGCGDTGTVGINVYSGNGWDRDHNDGRYNRDDHDRGGDHRDRGGNGFSHSDHRGR